MAQLTENTPRQFELRADDYIQRGVIGAAAAHLYVGAAIGATTIYGRQLVAGDAFLGFLEREVDNSAGSAGDLALTLRKRGVATNLAVTGVLAASTAVGTKVYASDSGTFTTTATANSYVGKITRVDSDGVADVYFEAADLRIGDS